MHGSIKWQVNTVLNIIREIGQSLDDAKHAVSYSNPHELAVKTGIYSYKTLDTYRNIARDLLQFSKENFATKNIEKLTPEVVSAYLTAKISQQVSYNTIKTYAAAIGKLATALNKYETIEGNEARFDFSSATASALVQAKGTTGVKEQSRAFSDPKAVIAELKIREFRVIANFQVSSGLRISELNHIRPDQLSGSNMVAVEQGKGGKDRIVQVENVQAFKDFKNLVNAKKETTGRYTGKYIFDKKAYTAAVTAAAKTAGEHPTASGTHCLRWNFAQTTTNMAQIKGGKTFREAQQATSESLGHNRIFITSHYLN